MNGYMNSRENYLKQYKTYRDSFAKGNGLASALQNILDKSYYTTNGEPADWDFPSLPNTKAIPMQWLRIDQLPTGEIGPNDNYRVKERVQGLMNTLHSLCDRFAFLLLRKDGFTTLYMGIYSSKIGSGIKDSLKTVAQVNLPGVKLSVVNNNNEVNKQLNALSYCGLITGQPSIRCNERENPLQSLDKLSVGLRTEGNDNEYALLIIVEPISDNSLKYILETTNSLRSDLSELRKQTMSVSFSDSAGSSISTGGSLTIGKLTNTHLSLNYNSSSSSTASGSLNVSREKTNSEVEYTMELLEKLIKRFEQGRNQGFWNSSIYVLGDSKSTVDVVTATARSVYAGQDTYMEPLRTFNFGSSSIIHNYITGMQFLPLPTENEIQLIKQYNGDNDDNWHIFGPAYQMLSTPINTEELSIVMSLPRKETAGLEIKKDAVEFSTNPSVSYNMRTYSIGDILNMGVENGHKYLLDIDQLNSHGVLAGLNGTGKSYTSRTILKATMHHKVPFLILDPVKLDYVRWADKYNQEHINDLDFKPITIYAPGMSSIPGIKTPITPLHMNPFKPYAAKGCPLNISSHAASLMALLRSTMAMGDFLPLLVDEALYNMLAQELGSDIVESNCVDPDKISSYPTLSKLKFYANELLKLRKYSKENTDNFNAAIETRVNSLTRGWKKNFFESQVSTDAEELFENNAVICLAGVSDNLDKAFLMAIILIALNEYRISCYLYCEEYRNKIEENRKKYNGKYLCHYTVVEEAHRIMQARNLSAGSSNAQTAVSEMFCEMLSEIREPGEGLMIIDQYPSRLVSDAIKNTNLKIIHKLQSEEDRHILASCMSLNESQSKILASLNIGETILYSGQDNSARWLHIR